MGLLANSAMGPLGTDSAKEISGLSSLLHHDISSPAERISIYQNNYQLALLNCLKTTFIHTYRLLGEGTFTQWANEYIAEHPSLSEDLNHYGECFSHFISSKNSNPSNDENNESWLLSHVAQSDYVKQCCYYAGNNQALPINTFINMPLDVQMNTDFVRQPSLFLMASPIDLTDMASIENIQDIPIQKSITYNLFFRNEGKVQVKIIDKALYDLLNVFEQPTNMNGLNEIQLEQLPTLLSEGWLKLVGAKV